MVTESPLQPQTALAGEVDSSHDFGFPASARGPLLLPQTVPHFPTPTTNYVTSSLRMQRLSHPHTHSDEAL